MKQLLQVRVKPYIQPFEKQLALAELRVLAGGVPKAVPSDNGGHNFIVMSKVSAQLLADKLAYSEFVSGRRHIFTTQTLREATVNLIRSLEPSKILKRVPFNGDVPIPNRRCLRYGTHGIHEYRGKYFPQLVRALINLAGAPKSGIIADPMVGSGTTVVEAILAGHNGLGLDFNPLSVFVAHTKCAVLNVNGETLLNCYQSVKNQLEKYNKGSLEFFDSLCLEDQTYLSRWFSPKVLNELDFIQQIIESVSPGPIRDFMKVVLSNILRRVSWQKEDDLRVRREIRDESEIRTIDEFISELNRSVASVLAFLGQNEFKNIGRFNVQLGDARSADQKWQQWRGKVDAVITSPPYATALPYLDTDRLSLIYLKLLSRREHRLRDMDMIGNREITDRIRNGYLQLFELEKKTLPNSIIRLIYTIRDLNIETPAGFRRQNLPSLLAKYFLDMRTVFGGIFHLLKRGGTAFVVIGNNHTVAGGQMVPIETDELLTELAMSIGFKVGRRMPMDMLTSRDIFRKNAVRSESILTLRKF